MRIVEWVRLSGMGNGRVGDYSPTRPRRHGSSGGCSGSGGACTPTRGGTSGGAGGLGVGVHVPPPELNGPP